jgi:predicted NAD/FAD-binding protein
MSNIQSEQFANCPIQKIAVVGSGIAGLSAAWLLSQRYDVTLLEANDYYGGHTHTVDITVDEQTFGVDTGFLVLNPNTYPNLLKLLAWLEVPTVASDMSFSVVNTQDNVQWAGTNLSTLLHQKRNLLRPAFWQMLFDIARFNRYAKAPLAQADWSLSLGDLLKKYRYSKAFSQWYLLPMTAAIWSCPINETLRFPAAAHIQFFRNHGLLQAINRPQWLTIAGGAKQYVTKMLAGITHHQKNTRVKKIIRQEDGVLIKTGDGEQHFDAVVLACHADQTLALLGDDVSVDERIALSQFKFEKNRAVLHTDARLLPPQKALWAAWNFLSTTKDKAVSVSYFINQLQPLPTQTPIIVTLNPTIEPKRELILGEFEYDHPVFNQRAHAAQQKMPLIQGKHKTWFCGAWMRYGFHEDGLQAGIQVASQLGVKPPWETVT